ncbi:MAG: septum formation initiator family protein [Pseudomonadota bacterium]|nr:septum formation initiator family protein [Pseudomonadota bacterium]
MNINSIISVSILVLMFLGFSYFFGESGQGKLNNLLKKETELLGKINTIKSANQIMEKEITSLIEDYAAVEKQAREKLGFIKKDEVFFRTDEAINEN